MSLSNSFIFARQHFNHQRQLFPISQVNLIIGIGILVKVRRFLLRRHSSLDVPLIEIQCNDAHVLNENEGLMMVQRRAN